MGDLNGHQNYGDVNPRDKLMENCIDIHDLLILEIIWFNYLLDCEWTVDGDLCGYDHFRIILKGFVGNDNTQRGELNKANQLTLVERMIKSRRVWYIRVYQFCFRIPKWISKRTVKHKLLMVLVCWSWNNFSWHQPFSLNNISGIYIRWLCFQQIEFN